MSVFGVRSRSDSALCAVGRGRRLLARVAAVLHLEGCTPGLACSHRNPHAHTCFHPAPAVGERPGSPGDPPRSPGLHQHRHLETPRTVLDVDHTLLQSGIAIIPGTCTIMLYCEIIFVSPDQATYRYYFGHRRRRRCPAFLVRLIDFIEHFLSGA